MGGRRLSQPRGWLHSEIVYLPADSPGLSAWQRVTVDRTPRCLTATTTDDRILCLGFSFRKLVHPVQLLHQQLPQLLLLEQGAGDHEGQGAAWYLRAISGVVAGGTPPPKFWAVGKSSSCQNLSSKNANFEEI